jgi:HAD superfamily hydrolase (TIGR01509 family)
MTQALLFDFNGVLVDDEEQHFEALRTALEEEGITLPRETYWSNFLGFDDRMSFIAAFQRAGRPLAPPRLAHLVATKSRAYDRLIDASLTLVPGAAEFVTRAARRFRLGVVSGALRHEIEHVLGHAGLRSHFEVIVSAEDVTSCKPDPQGYRAAHAALQPGGAVPPGRCVAIEDSLPGLTAARGAGLACVMLATSHPAEALDGADLVWESFVGHDPTELERLLGA